MKKYIYLCGPTVYDKVHIGNMRPIVTFDLILRGYKHLFPNKYIFIHNITDIDDKIILQSEKFNKSEMEISNKYYLFYVEMLKQYNIQTIDKMPKVTEHINEITLFIRTMINNNQAYEINKSIYFDTGQFKQYGEVSNIKLNKLQNIKNYEQRHEFDFVLWKNKKEGITWDTIIGNGRPGWHTECATFINKYTQGESLEIHGGGIDLKFPHHENENIQYIAVNNKLITKQWVHIGTINIKNQKMSKSLGNIIKADDFLNTYSNGADLFRLIILTSNINNEIEINDTLINPLVKKLNQLEKIINFLKLNNFEDSENKLMKNIEKELSKSLINYNFAHISKNLNSLIKKFNETKEVHYAHEIYYILKFLGFNVVNKTIDKELIQTYQKYKEFLENKDYENSDKLRKILLNHNLI